MASDRFINNCKRKPTKDDIGTALVDYLGDPLVRELRWETDRWFVSLPGKRSHPLRQLVDEGYRKKYIDPEMNEQPDTARWFEVWVDGNTVDVITRQQDELTSNIALGFAKLVARFWEGKLETG